jgi:hypothetical protein
MGRGRGTIKFWIFSGASSVQSRGSRGAREGAEARRGEEEKAERGSRRGRRRSEGGRAKEGVSRRHGEVLGFWGAGRCFAPRAGGIAFFGKR